VNLFQLSRSSASAPEPAAVPQASFDKNVAENGDLNSIFIQARQCHLNGDSVAASTHLLNAARRNHPPACAMLASFYLNGWGGLPQNYQLAFFLARWSALQKDPDGLGILACCYMFRLGTVQDLALAHTLAVGCANASPHGQFCLGYMHRHGLVVDKDAALAAR
jgi:TPR repeat protein